MTVYSSVNLVLGQLNQKLASMYCSIAVSVLELTMSWQLSVSRVVQGIPFPTVAAREARELQYHRGRGKEYNWGGGQEYHWGGGKEYHWGKYK